MAIVKIHRDLIEREPTLISVMKDFFDSVEELMKKDPDIYRFAVQGQGLPTGNQEIDFTVTKLSDDILKINHIQINAI